MKHTKTPYRPCNDFVLLRMETVDKTRGGVVVPGVSAEGQAWYAERLGPDVADLEVGDQVRPMGEVGQDIAMLPREKNLFVTKQANILLVVEPVEEEETP